MKKGQKEINLFEVSPTKNKSTVSDKVKTTDVNILLNRVRHSKKTEFKKRIIFSSILILTISLVGFFFLISENLKFQ